ncbi:hypothetical protein Tco_0516920 [Tanacetum coccineum]
MKENNSDESEMTIPTAGMVVEVGGLGVGEAVPVEGGGWMGGGPYATPLGADCSLSESRTSDTTSKTQKKEKVVVDTCDSLSSIDLNLCGAAAINIPSKLDAKILKKQTSSSPIIEELKDISPKFRSSKVLGVLRHLAL